MDRAIAQLNIDHFRKLLANETDEAKRATLQRLLADEEAKLKAANAAAEERKYKT